jgi:uncharacterized protein (DUF433 family)
MLNLELRIADTSFSLLAFLTVLPDIENMKDFDRITLNPAIMGGKPCIRGMRVTVDRLVSQIGAGESIEELLVDYPYLEREDILQALQYAAWLAEARESVFAGA